MRQKYLCWTDLETTGSTLDNEICEVGIKITDLKLNEIPGAEFETIVKVSQEGLQKIYSNEVVNEMHRKTGLLDDLEAGNGLELGDADYKIIKFLTNIGKPHDFMIAGSGVSHFDRNFIKKYMLNFDSMLAYPALDVGVLRRAWKMWGDKTKIKQDSKQQDGAHRALWDAKYHLEEARVFRSLIGGDAIE